MKNVSFWLGGAEIWNFYLDFSSEVEKMAQQLRLKRVSTNIEFRVEGVFAIFVIVDSVYNHQGDFLENDYTKIGEIKLDKQNNSPYLAVKKALEQAEAWLKKYQAEQIRKDLPF
ncbi:hypothetical protein HMPREF1430_00872 [Helicobacter pylori GAM96Ai]|uniref:hypothetical protein n=1 Tax=Helicobacter pylori TaxID=210 RepID=UPI0002B9A50C|nr:hypothetical protein [Helicobacter pylori]EMH42954.1 hypothetical protein HMPREF1430_00872 [Helicobacter pylori GAM96Ai]